jgi:hypothetical protein
MDMNRPLLNSAPLLILFIFCISYLASDALVKPINGDEIMGYSDVIIQPWWLILSGLPRQCSGNPLYYILQKKWAALWSFSPGTHWDVLLFMRWLSLFLWSSATCMVARFAQRRMGNLLGFLIGIMFFSNSYLIYYAVSDRPYMIWVCESLLQLLWLIQFAFEPTSKDVSKRSLAILFCIHLALVLTVSVGIIQSFAFVLSIMFYSRSRNTRIWAACHLLLVPIFIFYSRNTNSCIPSYYTFFETFNIFKDCLRNLMLSVFQTNTSWIKNLLFLLSSIGLVGWARKDPRICKIALFIFTQYVLLLTFALLVAHHPYAIDARQFLFAIPSMFLGYILGIFYFLLLSFGKDKAKVLATALLLIQSAYQVVYYSNKSVNVLSQRSLVSVFGQPLARDCGQIPKFNSEDVERFNAQCRGTTDIQPEDRTIELFVRLHRRPSLWTLIPLRLGEGYPYP